MEQSFPVVKRRNNHRVYVNRSLLMEKIKGYGFDMDYTLAEYISPHIDQLILEISAKILVGKGYPRELLIGLKHDPNFSARGLIYDNKNGNFLKIDQFGYILMATHGLNFLNNESISNKYNPMFIDMRDAERFAFFNTLFESPEMFLVSYVIQYFIDHENWKVQVDGFVNECQLITFQSLLYDIRMSVNECHHSIEFKGTIVENMSKYINKSIDLIFLLHRLKKAGKKIFLVTNSNYWYTNNVLSYLLDWPADCIEEDMSTNWLDYFDISIVSSKKPLFFSEGTTLSRIDLETGTVAIGKYTGLLQKRSVFKGGNSTLLMDMLGLQAHQILYVGDHIFGDILRSKKKQKWKTFLVVPELKHEIDVWSKGKRHLDKITKLEKEIAKQYVNADSSTTIELDKTLVGKIKEAVSLMDNSYGSLGSLFRCGYRHTFFSHQVTMFADIYSHSCTTLINYPFNYFFSAPPLLMPHEVTVKQELGTKEVSVSESIDSKQLFLDNEFED